MFEVMSMESEKKQGTVIVFVGTLGILGLIYLGGMIGQFMDHYKTWLGIRRNNIKIRVTAVIFVADERIIFGF